MDRRGTQDIGQAICYWLLPAPGIPIAQTSIQAMYQNKLSTDIIKTQLSIFFMEIEDTLRNLTVTEIFLIPSKCTGKMKKTKRKKIFLWNHK